MRKIILALLLTVTPAAAQQQWGQPTPRPQPQIVPAPSQTIMTPQGNITRNGPYVMYPDGSSAIVGQQGLTTYSNGSGCTTQGNSTYCW